jgi:hypothetical protein
VPPGPRVVVGAPLFEKAAYLSAAVESLLAQSFEDFALVLVDDRSGDDTAAIACAYAECDPRVRVHVNERRLGMLSNTRLALSLARELFPAAEFWALGSDHDLWHPRFLETLVCLLDAHPEAVLAVPSVQRIDEYDRPYPKKARVKHLTTLGAPDPRERAALAFRTMAAGNMVYGLFRTSTLDRLGHYRDVLVPDRLLLFEIALHGPTVQAPEVLWQRRFKGLADTERQRRAFWPEGPPAYTHLPWWLQHTGSLARAYGRRAAGRPLGIGRLGGMAVALTYLRLALAMRARQRWRRGVGRLALLRPALPGGCRKAARKPGTKKRKETRAR